MDEAAHVRDWLLRLGALVAPAMTPDEFDGRINLLAPELAEEFPAGAFTRETARLVARECRYFPNFAEIIALLGPLWRARRPALVAVEVDGDAELAIKREARLSWELITAVAVRAKIQAIREAGWSTGQLGGFLATAIAQHAPHHLGLLPPEWLPEGVEPKVVPLRTVAAAIAAEVVRGPVVERD